MYQKIRKWQDNLYPQSMTVWKWVVDQISSISAAFAFFGFARGSAKGRGIKMFKLKSVFHPFNCWVPLLLIATAFLDPLSIARHTVKDVFGFGASASSVMDYKVGLLFMGCLLGIVALMLLLITKFVLWSLSKKPGYIRAKKLGTYAKAVFKILLVSSMSSAAGNLISLTLIKAGFAGESWWVTILDLVLVVSVLLRSLDEPIISPLE